MAHLANATRSVTDASPGKSERSRSFCCRDSAQRERMIGRDRASKVAYQIWLDRSLPVDTEERTVLIVPLF